MASHFNILKNITMKKPIAYILLIFLLLVSCEKKIDFKIKDKERKIVINSLLSSDSLIHANISKSMHILDSYSKLQFLNNAIVEIWENDSMLEILSHRKDGNYYSENIIPIEGDRYKIIVRCEGLREASSEIIMPYKVPITNKSAMISESDSEIQCSIDFNDPANLENFYLFKVRSHIVFRYYSESEGWEYESYEGELFIDTNEPIVDDYSFTNEGIIFNDNWFDGESYNFTFNIDSYSLYDTSTVYFNLYSINKEYYQYLRSKELQNWFEDDPFSEAVQVFSNINDGIGILAGSTLSEDSIEIIIPPASEPDNPYYK